MQDDRLDSLLAELPRETARPDFTARVLARLDHRPRRLRAPAFVLAVTAAALIVALVLPRARNLGSAGPSAERLPTSLSAAAATAAPALAGPSALASPAALTDRAQARRMLHELSNEGAALEQELRRLQSSHDNQVIYLGGDDDVDMVINVRRVPTVRRAADHRSL
jgi:hypothetical protein